jgi:hypothetical protein
LLGAIGIGAKIVAQFILQDVSQPGDFIPPMQIFVQLLSPQRDQDADHDDADLADEGAPAVQRFRKMEMHARPRSEQMLTEPLMSAMGRKRTLGRMSGMGGKWTLRVGGKLLRSRVYVVGLLVELVRNCFLIIEPQKGPHEWSLIRPRRIGH